MTSSPASAIPTTIDLNELRRTLAINKFRFFVELMWPAVSQDAFVPGYHLDAICENLQAVAEGKIKRLVINVAVRHSKSLLCSVFFPVWLWLRKPSTRIVTASYSKSLTTRDSIRSRQLIEHPLFQSYFKGIFTACDGTEGSSRQDYYTNTQKGHRLAVSTDSRTSGFDADIIIADDLHDMQERNSESARNAAFDYFETTLQSRLVLTGHECVVIAGHRVRRRWNLELAGSARRGNG